jgi:hypothetical protein
MATGNQWVFQKQQEPKPVITVTPNNAITLHSGDIEMLKITEDGFYVRGVKLTQDDKEIKEVYNCFKEWLTWSTLNRN